MVFLDGQSSWVEHPLEKPHVHHPASWQALVLMEINLGEQNCGLNKLPQFYSLGLVFGSLGFVA